MFQRICNKVCQYLSLCPRWSPGQPMVYAMVILARAGVCVARVFLFCPQVNLWPIMKTSITRMVTWSC